MGGTMSLNDFSWLHAGKTSHFPKASDQIFLGDLKKSQGKKNSALLLFHGFSSTPAIYQYFFSQLNTHDVLMAPLLPGHGQDVNSFSLMKANDLFQFAEERCQLLLNEFEIVDVMGFSLGGLLACHLSQKFKLNHLYLLAPALSLTLPFSLSFSLDLVEVFQKLGFSCLRNQGGDAVKEGACDLVYRLLPLKAIAELLQLVETFKFEIPLCPCDLFLGCQDGVVNVMEVATFFASSSKTKIHWLANSAHLLPVDNDRDEILQVVQGKRF